MNKGSGGKQVWLRNGWFEREGIRIEQPMSYQEADGSQVQKGIQRMLEEAGLWPQKGLNLECSKPKCFNCEVAANCKICVKGHKCKTCKAPKQCSSVDCSKS